MIGKTNVPEWAAGSHTFNPIFGTTRNPYDLSRSAGGSSGGAAAALAAGMVPLADGSDMGGSLRNPASFCNVVGLRPSVGRVPAWPTTNAWELTSVGGPMARNVEDLALLLSVIAGPDDPGADVAGDARVGVRAHRCEGDLGRRAGGDVDRPRRRLRGRRAGRARSCRRRGTCSRAPARTWRPRTSTSAGAEEVFRTLRAWQFQHRFGTLLGEAARRASSRRWPTTSEPARTLTGARRGARRTGG